MTTIVAIEGNIITAIITTQAVTQNPSPPRSVPGPASMPPIRSPVIAQATAASSSSPKISPSCTALESGGARRRVADSISLGVLGLPLAPALRCALGHLAGELVVGRLAIDRVELDPEIAHLPGSSADSELGGEAEHRAPDCRLGVASRGPLEWLEGRAAVTDRGRRLVAVREADGCPLHAQPLVGESGELLERAAFVALEDPLECLCLLVRGALVHDESQLPSARAEVRGEQVHQADVDAREIG